MKRPMKESDLKYKGLPFECENCGNKPTAEDVVKFKGACELCGESIVAYSVDTAELILKLKQESK